MSLAEKLVERGAILFGEFTLTSGRKSDYYVNIKKAYTDPGVLSQIAEAVAGSVSGDRVAGVALGAIPIVVAVSLRTGKPFSMIRKEERSHGTAAAIEGAIAEGERVDILEDVTTTGGSVLQAAAAVRGAGGIVDNVVTVVDRGEGASEALAREGIRLHAVVTPSDLKEMLEKYRKRDGE